MASPALVPIHVDALVVEPGGTFKAPTPDQASPFKDSETLTPGVHLHWALPDGLTRGKHLPGDSALRFLAVPDLWLVVRWMPPASPATSEPRKPPPGMPVVNPNLVPFGRSYLAWVVDARTGVATPLKSWAAPTPPAGRPLLTAVGLLDGGALPPRAGEAEVENRLFDAAYYPASRGRFGFYDPLEEEGAGPFSYTVVGWYSRLEEDPLYAAGDDLAKRAFVLDRRWEVPWSSPASMPIPLMADAPPSWLPRSYTLSEGADVNPGRGVAGVADQKQLAQRQQRLAAGVGEAMITLGPVVVRQPTQTHPDRIYCHGAVVDVAWKGGGGAHQGKLPSIAKPELLVTPSLVAAAAEGFAKGGLDQVLQALTLDLEGELGTNASKQGLAHALHQASFVMHQGGSDPRWFVERSETGAGGGAADRLGFGGSTPIPLSALPAGVSEVTVRDQALRKQLGQLLGSGAEDRASFTRAEVMGLTSVPSLAGKVVAILAHLPHPRFYKPAAPVVMLSGCGRAWRYGQDGRLDPNRLDVTSEGGMLRCRVATGVASNLSIQLETVPVAPTVSGADLVGSGPALTPLPATAVTLVRESALLDPVNAPLMAEMWLRRAKISSADRPLYRPDAILAFTVETELWWGLADVEAGSELADEIEGETRYGGTLPSPIAVTPWRPPWAPLFAECEWEHLLADVAPKPGVIGAGWELGEVEHTPEGLSLGAVAASGAERRLLSVAVADQLVSTFGQQKIVVDPNGGVHVVGAEDAARMDVLTFGLSGLERALAKADAAVREGALRLKRLRLVDVFGQTLTLVDGGLPVGGAVSRRVAADEAALTALDPQAPPHALLPPRLPAWSRLQLRFTPAGGESPVCGYLLPDLVEHGVEVFDGRGAGLGQLVHARAPGGPATLRWQSHAWATVVDPQAAADAPGRVVADPRVRQLLEALLAAGPSPTGETSLSAALRALDTTWLSVDRRGGSTDALGRLVGRPVAIVRATVALETTPQGVDPSKALPAGAPLPAPEGVRIRLGSLTQVDDGVLGWLSASDPAHLHPVDNEILANAVESGPFSGYQGEAASAGKRPIDHPFVASEDTLALTANIPEELLFLLEPRGGIHGTTGILPRKRIALPDEHLGGMRALSPTFRAAPVLFPPGEPTLPLPTLQDRTWAWVQPTAQGFDEGALRPVTAAATLGDVTVVAAEGWLKLEAEG